MADGNGNVDGPVHVVEILGDDGNGENSQLDREHRFPTSGDQNGENSQSDREHRILTTGDQNGQNLQLDPRHANRRDKITDYIGIYTMGQAGILAGNRTGCGPLILSMLVSITTIGAVLVKLYREFKQVPEKECYWWVAEKAALIVMLMAFSVCIIFSITSETLPSQS